jgi:small-conductance mechanosensitive channel
MDMWAILETTVYGGTLLQWGVAAAVAMAVGLAASLAKPFVERRVAQLTARTHTSVDDALVAAVKATHALLVMVVAFAGATASIELSPGAAKAFSGLFTVALFLQVGLWANAGVRFYLERGRERALASNPGAATSLAALGFVARVVVWALVLLLALDNLGINVTALIAGLGIGGIAVALAVQNILGDLFASLSIVIDKPFVIGDFIIVNEYLGTVEYVGLKTTRIRSLGGEQIIFSNSDLLQARVRNYKRMYERRVVFTFGVLYQTTAEQLEKIPPLVRRIIEGRGGEKVRFDRAHFKSFGDSSLDFEVVFWVKSPDYNIYMDIQQAVNLDLVRELAKLEVGFAYPTRSLYLEAPVRVEAVMAAPRGDGAGAREDGGQAREDTPARR